MLRNLFDDAIKVELFSVSNFYLVKATNVNRGRLIACYQHLAVNLGWVGLSAAYVVVAFFAVDNDA